MKSYLTQNLKLQPVKYTPGDACIACLFQAFKPELLLVNEKNRCHKMDDNKELYKEKLLITKTMFKNQDEKGTDALKACVRNCTLKKNK